jgi:hypothetical protein
MRAGYGNEEKTDGRFSIIRVGNQDRRFMNTVIISKILGGW